MWYALLCMAVVALLVFGASLVRAGEPVAKAAEPVKAAVTKAVATSKLDRKDIQAKLQKLSLVPAPPPTPGAMCYTPAPEPVSAAYVCPLCGEKTIYTGHTAKGLQFGLDSARREFQLLQKVAKDAIRLDESEFCRKCTPGTNEPSFTLFVDYGDNAPHKVSRVVSNDIKLIRELLEGQTGHTGFNDSVEPLKNMVKRLEQLMGVSVTE